MKLIFNEYFNMSVFEMALERFSIDEQDLINKKLDDWSQTAPYGERIAKNFETEHFLPIDRMVELLSFILLDSSLDIETFEENYANECHKHVRQGGPIQVIPYPRFFGAAIEKKVLVFHLISNYSARFPSKNEAYDFITRLKSGDLPDDCKDLFFKQHSIWTTWNKGNSNPFEFCSTVQANVIRANLGLNKMLVSKELLLFIYEIPSSIPVLRPTISDAELSQYFEPPKSTIIEHGLTQTWKKQKWMKKFDIKPRPEGIHFKLEFKHLKLPIEARW